MKEVVRSVLLMLVGLSIGSQLVFSESSPETDEGALPLDELRTFTEVFAKVKSDYVEAVTDKQLLESAIEGMLAGLDPHSSYLDAEAYQELQEGTTGEFGGLGIEVGMEDGFVKVIAPIDDTPAQKAGIKAGDLIIKLDDQQVKGMSLNDAVKIMRGKPGTPITLTVVREGKDKPFDITITRAVIKVESVKDKTLEPHFGYIRISHFQTHTGSHLNKAITKLKQDNGNQLKGLVLDLRNNPGGILSAAVSVSDAFLDGGLIVYTEGRTSDSQLKFNAKPNDMLKGAPLVVLVNSGSASASEIVAGALQDRRRAVIMGSKTFGKGSVQTILPMNNRAALKLTTARYYTPSGRSIQAEGIEPDIILDSVKVTAVSNDNADIKEADLSRHLSNGNSDGNGKTDNPKNTKSDTKAKESIAVTDYEIYEALNLLKGLALLKKNG